LLRFIFDQLTSGLGGFVLGIATAMWASAVWLWWHPTEIRFWGVWSTNPRFLAVTGVLLVVAWLGFASLSLVLKP
jgi:hypothetical protein